MDYFELHSTFSDTEEGKKLKSEVRYDRYRPQHVSKDEWRHTLGADVNNMDHMHLTYGLTKLFIRKCNEDPTSPDFSSNEVDLLLLTAITHDWAEAVVGDHSFDLKTEDQAHEEATVLEELMHGSLGEQSHEVILYVKEILHDSSSKLGKAFNAIERLGYLRTGIRAWKMASEVESRDTLMASHLRWLSQNVLLNQIPKLQEYQNQFHPVNEYLVTMAPVITEMFMAMPDEIVTYYESGQQSDMRAKFDTARTLWLGSHDIAA